MPAKITNNATTTLAAGISAVAVSLTVAAGDGAKFPTVTGNDYFYVTLAGVNGLEIVKVTARATDVFTIVRAQDNTTAKVYSLGETVELRPVAAALTIDALMVDQTGNSGKLLTTNGTAVSWASLTTTGAGSTYVLSDAPTITTSLSAPTIITSSATMTLRQSVDNASVIMYGGSATADSASLALYGKTHANTGRFVLTANTGAASKTLIGAVGGSGLGLSWDGFNVWNNGIFPAQSKAPYTPVVTAGAGALTAYTATGEYMLLMDMYFVTVDVTITTVGTASGAMTVTLPNTVVGNSTSFIGREQGVTGKTVSGFANVGASNISCLMYDATTPFVASYRHIISGFYYYR